MSTPDNDLNDVIVLLLQSLSALQFQCSEQAYLLGDRLPGLTASQRRTLKATSRTYRALGEQTQAQARRLRKLIGPDALAAS